MMVAPSRQLTLMLALGTRVLATNELFNALEGGWFTSPTEEEFIEVLERSTHAQVNERHGYAYRGPLYTRHTVLIGVAASHDWPKAAAALIKRGCDVNAKDTSGYTALHYAGSNNRRETARVLLERGADRTIKDKVGKTAADYARKTSNYDLAAYIEGAPAPPLRAGASPLH